MGGGRGRERRVTRRESDKGGSEGRSSINSIIAKWVHFWPLHPTSSLSAMAFIVLKKKEQEVVVECIGHDAARFNNINHAHVSRMVYQVSKESMYRLPECVSRAEYVCITDE